VQAGQVDVRVPPKRRLAQAVEADGAGHGTGLEEDGDALERARRARAHRRNERLLKDAADVVAAELRREALELLREDLRRAPRDGVPQRIDRFRAGRKYRLEKRVGEHAALPTQGGGVRCTDGQMEAVKRAWRKL
jgi:hypothetical protein